VFAATWDGTVYMAIGGGVASSGTSVQAVMRADMLWSALIFYKMRYKTNLRNFFLTCEQGDTRIKPM
jgi:hypothetical protein